MVLTFVFAASLSAQTTPTTTTGKTAVKEQTGDKKACCKDGKTAKVGCCKDSKTAKAGCCKDGKTAKAGCCKDGKTAKAGCCKDGKGKAGCKGHEGNTPADSSACPHHKKAMETGTPDNK